MPTSLSNEIPPLIKKTNKMHLCHKRKKKVKEKTKRKPASKAKQTYSVELCSKGLACGPTVSTWHSCNQNLTQMSSYHTRVPPYKLRREEKS